MARDYERFEYYHSGILDLDYAVRRDRSSLDVTFEDGVRYTKEEQDIMGEVTPMVHLVKKVFKGEVLR